MGSRKYGERGVMPIVLFHFLNSIFLVSGISNNTTVCIQLREMVTIFLSSLKMLNFEKRRKKKARILYLPFSNSITEAIITRS